MEAIEIVVRNHLTTELIPTENIYTVIHCDAHQSASLLEMWNMLVPEDNPWKLDLLDEVATLWCTIRVHAFAKGWVEQFAKTDRKGTRKTLKNIGTDKGQ